MGKASRPGQNTNANARDLTDTSRSNRDFRQTDGVQMIGQHSAIERGESNDAGTHRTDARVGNTSHTLRTVQNFGESARGGTGPKAELVAERCLKQAETQADHAGRLSCEQTESI